MTTNMLSLGIYSAPPSRGGQLILNCGSFAEAATFSTNEHGFERLTATILRPASLAFQLSVQFGILWAAVYSDGSVVWEGRLEDKSIQASVDGQAFTFQAFGQWRDFTDIPHTGVWSVTEMSHFLAASLTDSANRTDYAYEMDNQPTIRILPTKGTTYATTKVGAMYYRAPAGGGMRFQSAQWSYRFLAPANWTATLRVYASNYTTLNATAWTLAGTGLLQTGSTSATFAGAAGRMILEFALNPGAGAAAPPETGDYYLEITAVRGLAVTTTTLYADQILSQFITEVNTANPGMLSTSTAYISSPFFDLTDELYADASMADVLTGLAALGGAGGNPFEVGVWEEGRVFLRRQGSAGREWYVDAASLDIQQTIDTLRNSIYAVYQDASGVTQRTATTTDTQSVQRWGLTRRAGVSVQTTSATQAATLRDIALTDQADPQPRLGLTFPAVYDSAGRRYPLWKVRYGDRITVRNLPVTFNLPDRIVRFLVARTSYDMLTDTLSVEPLIPLPKLDVQVAQLAERG